jgi:exodeoxyribonuclease V alpha subunit
LATQALLSGHNKGAFVLNYEHGTYHPTAMLVMEHVVAKRFLKLKEITTDWQHIHDLAYHESVGDLPYPLTPQQSSAVLMTMANGISCITGGAGTGKTSVLRTVLSAYNKLQFNIKAVALSGRAAIRLHESTGFITSTIAKFLREAPLDGNKYLIVIDEASMIDLQTMYRIVTHINPNTRLLFVGDPDQLAPIGAGLILADIVKSGVIANTMLDIVKRQESSTGIPEYSNLVKQGRTPPILSTGNTHFHSVPLEQITDLCVELYVKQENQSQIICATYKAQFGGIDEINRQCQAVCNPNGRQFEFELFGERNYLDIRLNDPVIFTQNDYDAGVQNGTSGRLVSIEQTVTHFGTVRIDTGEDIQLTRALLDSIRPGYAISLHKAQGLQFSRIIVPVTNSTMLDRNWVYTTITKAEVELHLVGPANLLTTVIRRVGATVIRQTHLANLLNVGLNQYRMTKG